MDIFTKKKRSEVMSKIRSSNTNPELFLRVALKGNYLRYQPKGVLGKPDFASKKLKIAIFIDGCFWHKCPKCFSEPKTNKSYWKPKIERNVARAIKVNRLLKKQDWRVIRLWEHDVARNRDKCINKIKKVYTEKFQ